MKKIPLVNRRGVVLDHALVDDDDYERLMVNTWHLSQSAKRDCRYACRSTGKGPTFHTISIHRMVVGLGKGDRRQVDHIDGNGLNNQRSNLRIASIAENLRNRGPNKNNKSGFKGVSWCRRSGKWQASITVDRRQRGLGLFVSAEDAAAAYLAAATRLHGEFANVG